MKVGTLLYRPRVGWWTMIVLWVLWYGWIGPLWFWNEPWMTLDLVRPWLIFQAHWMAPALVFWMSAAWGIMQDIWVGDMIGPLGLIWGSEGLLILVVRHVVSFPSWAGAALGVALVLGFHHGAIRLMGAVLGMPVRLEAAWIGADYVVNVLLIRVAFAWWERFHYEPTTRRPL